MRITQMRKRLYQMLILSFSLLILAGTSYADLNQGLVAHYPFDGNADDASGNGHNGSPSGAILTSDRMGNPNSAYRFDGQSYIRVPEDGSFNVSNLTISLWISFLSGPYCNNYVRPMSFVSKSAVYPVGSNTGYIFPYIGFGDCNSFGLIVNTTGSGYFWDFNRSYSYTSITDPGKWHIYTATYDGAARKVYVDCKLVSTDYNLPNGDIKPNSNDLYIGVQAGTQEYATADMDDLRIYGRALSDPEVQSLCIPVQPPISDAGASQIIECAGPNGTAVTLNGSGSSDPDGDTLTYLWTWNGGAATGVNPTVTLPLGTHTITLTVDDGKGGTATDTVIVTVRDTVPPASTVRGIAGIGGDNGWYKSDVLIAVDSADACSGVKEIRYSVDGAAATVAGNTTTIAVNGDGSHGVTFGATDNAGNVEQAKMQTINIDKTVPSIAAR